MDSIGSVIKEFLTSKKFIVAVSGVVIAAAGKIGLELSTETVGLLIAPVLTYLISQGWSDRGKEAAKVTAVAEAASTGGMVTQDTIDTIKNT